MSFKFRRRPQKRVYILRPGQTTRVFKCGGLPIRDLIVGKNEALVVVCKLTGRRYVFICTGEKRISRIRVKFVNRDFRVTCS